MFKTKEILIALLFVIGVAGVVVGGDPNPPADPKGVIKNPHFQPGAELPPGVGNNPFFPDVKPDPEPEPPYDWKVDAEYGHVGYSYEHISVEYNTGEEVYFPWVSTSFSMYSTPEQTGYFGAIEYTGILDASAVFDNADIDFDPASEEYCYAKWGLVASTIQIDIEGLPPIYDIPMPFIAGPRTPAEDLPTSETTYEGHVFGEWVVDGVVLSFTADLSLTVKDNDYIDGNFLNCVFDGVPEDFGDWDLYLTTEVNGFTGSIFGFYANGLFAGDADGFFVGPNGEEVIGRFIAKNLFAGDYIIGFFVGKRTLQ